MHQPPRERRQSLNASTVVEITEQGYTASLADGFELLGPPGRGKDAQPVGLVRALGDEAQPHIATPNHHQGGPLQSPREYPRRRAGNGP